MKNLLKPTAIKILIFLSPIVYLAISWIIVTSRGGINSQNILRAIEITWENLSFPGLILCVIIPYCEGIQGDVIWVNPLILYPAHFIILVVWYLISVTIGKFTTPIYNRLTEFLVTITHLKPNLVALSLFIVFLFSLYLIASFQYKKFWYKTAGGRHIIIKENQIVDGYLKVHLENLGFENISLDEIQIYAENTAISCEWEGDLSVKSTAVCTSTLPLCQKSLNHFLGILDIEIKVPGSTTQTSVNCM